MYNKLYKICQMIMIIHTVLLVSSEGAVLNMINGLRSIGSNDYKFAYEKTLRLH